MNVLEHSVQTTESVIEKMHEHEQIVFCNDPTTGLKAIIAIHNTTLGPALGGLSYAPLSYNG